MRFRTIGGLALLASLTLAGCGVSSGYNTAQMPYLASGAPAMTQNDAIAVSAWVLKNPGVAHGDPALAARAIAAEDWLAGQVFLTGNFDTYAPARIVYWQLLRNEVRSYLGIPTDAPSQLVVERLLSASAALSQHDESAAASDLQPPAFGLGPTRTIAALSNLPVFSQADRAFADLTRNGNRGTCRENMPNC
ncbi:MAG TPA: hypothetical protein VME92_16055 [Acetobacteraceae bacterium]|nr:hypothetical protein [Acetobacteraceae bacterium]